MAYGTASTLQTMGSDRAIDVHDPAPMDLFPGWIRLATRASGKFKAGARKARILRYRF